jgi:hypothetical protein
LPDTSAQTGSASSSNSKREQIDAFEDVVEALLDVFASILKHKILAQLNGRFVVKGDSSLPVMSSRR